jgi:hypothetical protein
MVTITIEYKHTNAELTDPTIRRRSTAAMVSYIKDLMFDMQMGDIDSKFIETIIDEGPNTVLINGREIPEIIDGLKIKMLEVEDSCDHGQGGRVTFGRPTLDWKKDIIEDVPDTIMKNAIAKVFADESKNELPVVDA